jgi:hypothetical protein
MPRLRRRRKDRHEGFNTERTCYRLWKGHDLWLWEGEHLSDADLAEAWRELGCLVTAFHVRAERGGLSLPDHHAFNDHQPAPGSRPWGWWEYEAPEPRRPAQPAPVAAGRLFYGLPRYGTSWDYESEESYLRRLELLTPEEEGAIAALALTAAEQPPCPG